MKSEYKVENGNIVKISVEVDMNQLVNELESKKEKYGFYGNVFDRVESIVAEHLAKEFISLHTHTVLSKIDPERVASMVSLKTLDRLTGGGR